MISVKLVEGGTALIDLNDIWRVDGGTIYPGLNNVPETLVVLRDGRSLRAAYDELGKIVNALQAAGLL